MVSLTGWVGKMFCCDSEAVRLGTEGSQKEFDRGIRGGEEGGVLMVPFRASCQVC